jgi:hypothetical protein
VIEKNQKHNIPKLTSLTNSPAVEYKKVGEQYLSLLEASKRELRSFLVIEGKTERPKHLKIESLIKKLDSTSLPLPERCFDDLQRFLKIYFKDELGDFPYSNTSEGFDALLHKLKDEFIRFYEEFKEEEFFLLTQSPMLHLVNYVDRHNIYCAVLQIREDVMCDIHKVPLGLNAVFFLDSLIRYGTDCENEEQKPVRTISAEELNKHYSRWRNQGLIKRASETGDKEYSRMWRQIPKEILPHLSKSGEGGTATFCLHFDGSYCHSGFSLN